MLSLAVFVAAKMPPDACNGESVSMIRTSLPPEAIAVGGVDFAVIPVADKVVTANEDVYRPTLLLLNVDVRRKLANSSRSL